jgi:hypothetical protein
MVGLPLAVLLMAVPVVGSARSGHIALMVRDANADNNQKNFEMLTFGVLRESLKSKGHRGGKTWLISDSVDDLLVHFEVVKAPNEDPASYLERMPVLEVLIFSLDGRELLVRRVRYDKPEDQREERAKLVLVHGERFVEEVECVTRASSDDRMRDVLAVAVGRCVAFVEAPAPQPKKSVKWPLPISISWLSVIVVGVGSVPPIVLGLGAIVGSLVSVIATMAMWGSMDSRAAAKDLDSRGEYRTRIQQHRNADLMVSGTVAVLGVLGFAFGAGLAVLALGLTAYGTSR